MEWNFKDGLPIYSQIIAQMSMRIASKAYVPGEKLPSVRDMATDAGVNPNTMQRALGELERQGLLYTERTSGRYITKEEEVLKELHRKLAMGYIEELFEKLSGIGMSEEEIREAVNDWHKEDK
jgi:GntR family transcriptional regulator